MFIEEIKYEGRDLTIDKNRVAINLSHMLMGSPLTCHFDLELTNSLIIVPWIDKEHGTSPLEI